MTPRRATFRKLRALALTGVAALCLSACATNRARMEQPDFSGLSQADAESNLGTLTARYKKNPKDKATIVYYSAALRAAGQPGQAAVVLEAGIAVHPDDPDLRVAYAKALSAAGRFDQSLNVLEGSIRHEAPDWNALLVKGAVLDQMGRHAEARATYSQALTIAPHEASIEANIGLSYAMTSELDAAESHLRKAVQMPKASSQIRQNLALVVGLQGRFDESRAMFAAELPSDQVEANMAYIRALLTQQNRWDAIEGEEG